MVENLGEWPSKRRPLTKIRPSDGSKGDAVPLAVDQWYDFHKFGCHLGNVGLNDTHELFGKLVSSNRAPSP